MRIEHPARALGKKIVIIIGGGFGGLNAAKTLANEESVYVLLIDQRNHHLFQPLLYQVATAGLNPADIAVPIRAQFSDIPNVEVHWEKILEINFASKTIRGVENEIIYDYLILACGSRHSYFNHPEWEEFAPGLKTLEQATEIRRRILSAFEQAENELDPKIQKALLNFVVVGGGPTGVELVGAIAEISQTVLVNDFKRIDPSRAHVLLIEAGDRILASFDPKLSERATKDLEELGVEVQTRTRVDKIDKEGVSSGSFFIPSKSVLWAAGVQAAQLKYTPPPKMDRAGRIEVLSDLSIPGFRETFVVGDMALVRMRGDEYVPGLAPAAIQEGRHAAEMILATIHGEQRRDFIYNDKGQMATIGKSRAVLQIGHFKMGGYFAWLAWLLIHIFYLIGFKNRIAVMAQWAWSYIFSKRGARLITEQKWKL